MPLRSKTIRSLNKVAKEEALKAKQEAKNSANPTSRSTWKRFERTVASLFGTRRTPLSGSNSGHKTNSDSLHPDIYIEAKLRSRFTLWELFQDTAKKAKLEQKVPVVAFKQKGERGFLLIIRPEDLELLTELKNVKRTETTTPESR